MICQDCEKGMVRLQLTNISTTEEGLFPKSLSGFQTVPCPICSGTGVVSYYESDDHEASVVLEPIKPIYSDTI